MRCWQMYVWWRHPVAHNENEVTGGGVGNCWLSTKKAPGVRN